jgi:hypothetical protein
MGWTLVKESFGMNSAARIAQLTVRGVGLLALILGLLFWGGDARGLIPVHMLLGLIVAIALVVLSVAAIAGGRVELGVVGIVVAVLLVIVGMGQGQMLPGDNHWIVQVLHILLGMGAIGCGEVIGKRLGLTGAARARAH